MITLGHEDSQFVNYSKGHYVRTDMMADIRKLVARRALVPLESVTDGDVLGVFLSILEHLQLGPRMLRGNYMENVVFGRYYGLTLKNQTPIENFVQASLTLLYELTKDDYHWEEADAEYLPFSPELIKRREENARLASTGNPTA